MRSRRETNGEGVVFARLPFKEGDGVDVDVGVWC